MFLLILILKFCKAIYLLNRMQKQTPIIFTLGSILP